jgi:hypothetical protein
MQVFVAGATGTIGASLIEQLLASGHEVIGLRHQASGHADVRWVTADVLDRDALLRAVRGRRADSVSWTNFIGYLARALDAPNPRKLPSGLLKMFAPYGYAVLRGGVCLANDKAKQELHWRPATPSYRLGLDRLAQTQSSRPGSVKRPDAVR